jgi:hypothetical protein
MRSGLKLLAATSLMAVFLLRVTEATAFDGYAGHAVMPAGEGSFEVGDIPRGPVTVYTYRPASAHANSPIWIVMHGARRESHRHLSFDYYDTWRPLAERYGAILLVPEFTSDKWPGAWGYNLGNIRGQKALQQKPWRQTAFYVVEQSFKAAVRMLGGNQRKFSIFGHGAGSQFVQRYVLHSGCNMIDKAVSANPGWYMLPDNEYMYPYGLGGAPIAARKLRGAFACDYTVLLGAGDVNFSGLRDEPPAAAQGKTRFARGHFYFNRSRDVAANMGARFAWHLIEVPGVGHESHRMAPFGAAALAGRPPDGS